MVCGTGLGLAGWTEPPQSQLKPLILEGYCEADAEEMHVRTTSLATLELS